MLGTTEPKKTESDFYFGGPTAFHGDASSNIARGGGGAQPMNFLQGVFNFANTGTLENGFQISAPLQNTRAAGLGDGLANIEKSAGDSGLIASKGAYQAHTQHTQSTHRAHTVHTQCTHSAHCKLLYHCGKLKDY